MDFDNLLNTVNDLIEALLEDLKGTIQHLFMHLREEVSGESENYLESALVEEQKDRNDAVGDFRRELKIGIAPHGLRTETNELKIDTQFVNIINVSFRDAFTENIVCLLTNPTVVNEENVKFIKILETMLYDVEQQFVLVDGSHGNLAEENMSNEDLVFNNIVVAGLDEMMIRLTDYVDEEFKKFLAMATT